MLKCFFFLCCSQFLAVSSAFSAWDNQRVSGSYKDYIAFKNKKKEFERKQNKFLELRKQNIKQQKQIESAKRAYFLDFLSNIQKDKKESERLNQFRGLSKQEKAFFDHQQNNRELERERVKDFSKYKAKYKAYQKRQKNFLNLRLKELSVFRRQLPKETPVF